MLKWNFSSTGPKIHQKHFSIKATPILTLQPMHYWLTLEGSQTVNNVFSVPRWGSEGHDTVDLKLSQTSFLYKWRHFSILQTLWEIASNLRNTHQWRNHVTNRHHLSKSKFQFNTMFRNWDTKGAELPPLKSLQIIMNLKILKTW